MNRIPRHPFILFVLLALMLVALVTGCGGGSVGTGTEPRARTTFTGAVRSEAGAPVAGALIKLLNTDETVTSAADGSFLLASTLEGGDASFEVSSGAVRGEVSVSAIPNDGAAVDLSLVINFADSTVSLVNLSVTAKIEGACDPFFENTRTIRQAQRVPDGTRCPVRVRTSTGLGPLSGLKFVLQRRRCPLGSPWHEVGSGVTGNVADGVGELEFLFSNDEEHCVYQIVVPVDVPNVRSQIFNVDTFRKQAFDAGQPFDPNQGDGR